MIFSAPIPQKEGLSLLFIAAFVIGMARLADERYSAAKATLIIGATTAGMALTQPAFATLAVTMYVALFIWKREARSRIARSAVGAFAVCSVLMLPWWVRNYLLFGDFVPLTTAMGANLWMGMHGTTRNLPPELRSADLQELERYRAIGRAALELIAANPVAYVIDSFLKPVRALIFQDHVALKLMQFRPSLNGTEIRFLMPPLQLSYIFLLAAAARSLCSSRFARWHGFLIVALSAAFAQMFVFQIWFEFEERHRGYLIIILLMLIALGINESRKLRTQRQ
jgi:hypothetical protein